MNPVQFKPEMSILGYGDMLLPGLLLVYLRQFDKLAVGRRLWAGYHAWAITGYSLGLLASFVAMYMQVIAGVRGRTYGLGLGRVGRVACVCWSLPEGKAKASLSMVCPLHFESMRILAHVAALIALWSSEDSNSRAVFLHVFNSR